MGQNLSNCVKERYKTHDNSMYLKNALFFLATFHDYKFSHTLR